VRKAGERVSTVDLVGNGFVVFTGAKGDAWAEAAHPLEVKPIVLGEEEPWRELYGIDETGAVLVRPDGHVAWRSPGMVTAPDRALAGAMNTIRGKA
jgi:hypothetical protein